MPSPRKKMMFLAVPPVVTSGAHALTGSSPPLPPVPELLDEVEEDEDVEEDDVDELPPVDALEEEESLEEEEEALAPPLPVPGSEEQPTQRHVAAMDTQAALNRVERVSMGSISLKAAPFVPW
jgi:hypothetical protein